MGEGNALSFPLPFAQILRIFHSFASDSNILYFIPIFSRSLRYLPTSTSAFLFSSYHHHLHNLIQSSVTHQHVLPNAVCYGPPSFSGISLSQSLPFTSLHEPVSSLHSIYPSHPSCSTCSLASCYPFTTVVSSYTYFNPFILHISFSSISHLYLVAGSYCGREGLALPTAVCRQGYYCPVGQVTATPGNYTCPSGHFCLTGVGDPAPCPSGSYQVGVGGRDRRVTCQDSL